MYIQGSAIDKRFKGSLEHRAIVIKEAIDEHFGDTPVHVLATREDHAYAVNGDGNILKVTYKVDKDGVSDIKSKATKDIPVIEDDNLSGFVSAQLRELSEMAAKGKKLPRTQVREVMQLLDKDEDYWVSDILDKLGEATGDNAWINMYEANQEQIRTAMYGSIRKIESAFPNTRFTKIAASKLSGFEVELKEALNIIASLSNKIVDECTRMVFDEGQEEFFSAICESLIVEAQAIGGLLGKAEKLMRVEDINRMAEAHDRLTERTKTMAVVSAYIKSKSQQKDNEE